MKKCPNCNYNLSSSDVLCPKCGALVEEINTNVIINRPSADVPEDGESADKNLPDHYENIILYNETFPIIDSEPPKMNEEPPPKPEEEPEDFDIEEILSEQSTKHVNPLLAHIEKQLSSNREDYKEVLGEDEQESAEDEQFLRDEDFEDELPADEDESFGESPAMAEDEEPYDTEQVAGEADEYPAEEPETAEKDLPAPIAVDELQEIAKEISNSSKEPEDGFPISGVPAYSKAYLDAIRNAGEEAEDEDLDIDEFDPEEFMEKYKAEAKEESEPESSAAEPQAPEAAPEPEPAEEEPVRRRYNPNKPKPKYDEAEMQLAAQKAAEEAKAESEKAQEKQEPEQQPEAAPEEQPKQPGEDKKEEEEKDDGLLELELDPERFFVPVDDEQPSEDEHFIIEQDHDEPEPDTQPEKKQADHDYGVGAEKKSSASSDPPIIPTMSKQRRIPVWASVLIWLAVAGAVFFGAYTFDKYVKNNYQTYGNYIYEITDGKIDVDGN